MRPARALSVPDPRRLIEGLPQAQKLGVLRVQAAQVAARLLCGADSVEDRLRRDQGGLVVVSLTTLHGVDTSATCMPGILKHGETEPNSASASMGQRFAIAAIEAFAAVALCKSVCLKTNIQAAALIGNLLPRPPTSLPRK